MPIAESSIQKKPHWLRVQFPTSPNFFYVDRLLKEKNLHSICQSAKCPNISECWTHKTATFLLLGDVCTRNCAFCAVKTGKPEPVSENEGSRIADAVSAMGLQYVVLTSVTRDDLHDGGASFFAETIRILKKHAPHIKIEVLIPDFNGQVQALKIVIDERPDVLNHNLEVPEVLYPYINRKKENYARSLHILEEAKKMGSVTKSGIMLGLGETGDDVLHVLQDLRRINCDLLTLSQYLKATPENINVKKYVSPEEFERLKKKALSMGFIDVEAGPLIRSSYNAHKMYRSIQKGVV